MAAAVAAYLEGPCTEAQKEQCKANSGQFVDQLCKTCPKAGYAPDPYVQRLASIHALQSAGFRFDPDDLPLPMWLDLAAYKHTLDIKTSAPRAIGAHHESRRAK